MEGEWDGGGRDGVMEGRGRLAIILHRFTPVRDGWTRNEVWDLGVSVCACLRLIAFWMYYGLTCHLRVCVCVCVTCR